MGTRVLKAGAEMCARGCGEGSISRNRKWDLRGESWATTQPVLLFKDPGPLHWVDLSSHDGSLEPAAGLPPCLAFPWAAQPFSAVCIPCHLAPPYSAKSTAPCKASASCVLTCECPRSSSPVHTSWRSHTQPSRFVVALVCQTCSFSSWHANHYHFSLALPLWV